MTHFNVFGWNLLTEAYCDPAQLPSHNPEFLIPSYRHNIIMNKIKIQMSKKSIIALQEVDINLYNQLAVFFAANNYFHVYNSYDSKRSLYMGILIAWPIDYTVKKIDQVRVGDYINKTKTRATDSNSTDQKDPWNIAQWRKNWAIMVTFELDNKSFMVANYHMPCTYWCESATILHAGSLIEILESRSNGYPVILLSDCNFTPATKAYELFTTMEYDTPENLKCHESEKLFENIDPDVSQKYCSAYKKFYGEEPEYTIWTTTYDTGAIFKDTLDYIWIRGHNIDVEHVDKLSNNSDGLIPNKIWPSDHFSLAARLHIK